jgi:hypothetical protein
MLSRPTRRANNHDVLANIAGELQRTDRKTAIAETEEASKAAWRSLSRISPKASAVSYATH